MTIGENTPRQRAAKLSTSMSTRSLLDVYSQSKEAREASVSHGLPIYDARSQEATLVGRGEGEGDGRRRVMRCVALSRCMPSASRSAWAFQWSRLQRSLLESTRVGFLDSGPTLYLVPGRSNPVLHGPFFFVNHIDSH